MVIFKEEKLRKVLFDTYCVHISSTVETGYNEGLGKLDFVRYNRFSL